MNGAKTLTHSLAAGFACPLPMNFRQKGWFGQTDTFGYTILENLECSYQKVADQKLRVDTNFHKKSKKTCR